MVNKRLSEVFAVSKSKGAYKVYKRKIAAKLGLNERYRGIRMKGNGSLNPPYPYRGESDPTPSFYD